MSFGRFNRPFTILMMTFVLVFADAFMPGLSAQYFGRNKVQYENFDFRVIETDHFKVYHYPEEKQAAEDASFMAERWYNRFSRLFNHEIKNKQPLILYANPADFQQTNVIQGLISQSVGGVTEGLRQRVVIPMTGIYSENNHVIGHELAHAFQYDIARKQGVRLSRMGRLPLFFIEGTSEYLSVGRRDVLTSMWMRDAVVHDDLPGVEELSWNSRYFPYRWGHAFMAYVAGRLGDDAVLDLYLSTLNNSWSRALEAVFGDSLNAISDDWKHSIRNKFLPQVKNRTHPDSLGKLLIHGQEGMNLAPAISPDGRYLAFISSRELFTLDLYLADAQTGEVLDELASSNTDAHFDALRFTNSSGSWSPDSRKFAFIVFKDGDNAVAVLDVESRDVENVIPFKNVGNLKDLAFSPDGSKIVMAGTSGGVSDLYIYDFQEDTLEQLTDDRYAEIQPDWSPDGETIAFATDRGKGTDFEKLVFERMNIGLLNTVQDSIVLLSIEPDARHIQPQFSADGNSLYFISDPDGFSNLYRYSFSEQSFYRLTDVATGISGLTEMSPTMSIAPDADLAAFTVFSAMEYSIHTLDLNRVGEFFHSVEDDALATNVSLPPTVYESFVNNYMLAENTDRPALSKFRRSEYSPSLDLIYAGRSTLGVAVDRYGSSLGGAVNLLYSDMLGNHLLNVTAQINGGLKDLGGQALYMNRDSRINWGAMVGHIPYQTARMFTGYDTVMVNGNQVIAREYELVRERVFSERASLMAEYPLSRNRRFEVATGYNHISYEREVDRAFVSGGIVVGREEEDLDGPEPLNLWQSSLAYVGDYSFFGFTSPVAGKRFRFEVEPTLGSLQYLTLLLDYRHYFHFRPVTLAFRAVHLGRYLEDSESDRLSELYLGNETMVRGYSLGSFDLSECTDFNEELGCVEVDRLIGSRLAVFNAELRLPLLGNSQYGLINFPTLPTELSLFFDGGLAWKKGQNPKLDWTNDSGHRVPVFSAGMSARVNLFGYLVSQFYLAVPFQRPNTNTQFGFVIAPGW